MKIEKNIPMPQNDKRKYEILKEMEIGDSIYIPCTTEKVTGRKSTLYAAARAFGIKVTARTEEGGFRIWRAE